jgi:hypothetical protein
MSEGRLMTPIITDYVEMPSATRGRMDFDRQRLLGTVVNVDEAIAELESRATAVSNERYLPDIGMVSAYHKIVSHITPPLSIVCVKIGLLMTMSLFVCNSLLAQQLPSPNQAASPKRPLSNTSVLLVDTDDTCRLLIDDQDKGVVSPDH